jgi:hypothetical protein
MKVLYDTRPGTNGGEVDRYYTFPDGLKLHVYETPWMVDEPRKKIKEEKPMVLYARVKFESGDKQYDYLTYITGLKPGDDVIVEAGSGIAYGKFAGYSSIRGMGTKFITAKVDGNFIENTRVKRDAIVYGNKCFTHYKYSDINCQVCLISSSCKERTN